MARNRDAIHILRGSSENIINIKPEAGQPLYDKTNNILYIGDGEKSPNDELKALNVADRAITSVKIAVGGVEEINLHKDAVTTTKIADRNITSIKIGFGEVKTDNLDSKAVKSGNIDDEAVNTDNIADWAVTTVKLGAASVTLEKVDASDESGRGLSSKFVTRDTNQTISGSKEFITHIVSLNEHKTTINYSGITVFATQSTNTRYSHSAITRRNDNSNYTINLPTKAGTLALTSDTVNMSGDQTGIAGNKSFTGNLSTDGNITAHTFYATSDRRLKENIVDYKPEKSILDIPVKEYNFIGDDKKHIGFIAQDLQKVFPELVTERADGYLSIEESKLIYLLIDEVKKLKEKVGD